MYIWATIMILVQTLSNPSAIYLFFRWVTEFGSETFFIIIIPPIYWCVNKKLGFRLLVITTLAAYVTSVLKNLTRVPRPGEHLTESTHRTYAFPSGHTHGVTTFWLYLMIKTKRFIVGIIGIVLILFVSISRVYLNLHYPGDVIAGIALGVATVLIFFAFEDRITTIVKGWNFQERLFFSTVPPLLLVFHAALFFHLSPQGVKLAAALFGILLGAVLEGQYLKFSVKSTIRIKIYRIILGLFIAYIAHYGFGMVLPFNVATCFFTAFFGGFTVVFLAPWLFIKIEKLQYMQYKNL